VEDIWAVLLLLFDIPGIRERFGGLTSVWRKAGKKILPKEI